LKRVRDATVDATNLVLLVPAYFVGVGVSIVLWRIHSILKRKDNEAAASYWIESKPAPGNIEEMEKMV
jgi:hypothetical protein